MLTENQMQPSDQIAAAFRNLNQPARLEILLALGSGEACVCHLEVILQQRQAYISQHLMALRDAAILTSRREGRFVYYRVADPRWLDLIQAAAVLLDIDPRTLLLGRPGFPQPGCGCPHCAPGSDFVTVFENFAGPAASTPPVAARVKKRVER